MTNPLLSAISSVWSRNGAYAARLAGDLAPGQFLAQPVAGLLMNHPAWILSHLLVYKTLCVRLLRNESFDDPISHPHGPRSSPLSDPSAYPAPADLVRAFAEAHAEAARALAEAPDDFTDRVIPLVRWRTMVPSIGALLLTLMAKHEAHHLGQLSAWRRAMRLPPVDM